MLVLLLVLPGMLPAQTLYLDEGFSCGETDNGDITTVSPWVRHGGAQGPGYLAAGLSYAGYEGSDIGGCLSFTKGSGGVNDGDVNRGIGTTLSSAGTLYISFLVNLTSAQGTNDYFIHLGPASIGNTFRARVYAKTNGAGFSLGLAKSSETPALDTTVLYFGVTYLVVLTYTFRSGSTSDDEITLRVYRNEVPVSEPGSPLAVIGPYGSGVAGDPGDIGTIAVRQGSSTPTGRIDGIRVSDSWTLAPLPVELVSFNAVLANGKVELHWATAMESNNYGFEVQRNSDPEGWQAVGFAEGHGTTNSPQHYAFVDRPAAGKTLYRLRQIDRDGAAEYSHVIELSIPAASGAPVLSSNFPNPANPVTVIRFNVPAAMNVTLWVENLIGQKIATLVDGVVEGGKEVAVRFDASTLPSGVYLYTLRAGSYVRTRKMMVLK